MNKPAPQVSLEAILKSNKEAAAKLLQENERIEAEMHKILTTSSFPPPPVSRLMEAFSEGVRATTPVPVDSQSPASEKLVAEKEVVFAAVAIVRSWTRRHKKNWKIQEKELMNAVRRLTWEK